MASPKVASEGALQPESQVQIDAHKVEIDGDHNPWVGTTHLAKVCTRGRALNRRRKGNAVGARVGAVEREALTQAGEALAVAPGVPVAAGGLLVVAGEVGAAPEEVPTRGEGVPAVVGQA